MGRLRLAVVTPELPNRQYPNRGRAVYETLRQLGSFVELHALCPLPRYPSRLHPRFDYRKADLSYALADVNTRYFEYPALPIVTRPFNGLVCAHYLEPHLRAFQADVILNFWVYPAGFAALTVGRKMRIPVVVGSIGSDLNGIPDPVSRWLTRKTLNGASRIIAKSEQLQLRMIEMGVDPKKTHIVVNGCDNALFCLRDRGRARAELDVPFDAKMIAFVGRLHARKGVCELLEAVGRLSLKRRNLSIVYVGDGPELAALRERVHYGNLAEHVKFVGACSGPDVARWLAASNLLVLPSYAEGCPNAVIEALNCGRPVVATDVGSLPQLVDATCGLLVKVGDIEALCAAIDHALDMQWDEEGIAKRYRRSWRQVAEEVLTICEASVSEHQARCVHH
jgi:teichuronic acid biosynthesis glycosyltransferase TuaC